MKRRRLTKKQQQTAEDALRYVQPSIASFVKRNPDLRPAMRRCDLESTAYQAVCLAALTYDPDRSRPTTYFGAAIRHALYREVLSQQRQDGRYVPVDKLLQDLEANRLTAADMRAIRALRKLSASDRSLLEDRLIEQISFERLGREHGCDPRTIAKRVRTAIESLRLAEDDLA